MPTIYTKDIVAESVEQNYLGEQGVYTGSVANSIGYSNYLANQNSTAGSRVSRDAGGSSDAGAGFFGLCAFGALAYGAYWVHEQTGSWWAVAGAGVALALTIVGIVAFFRTRVGQVVLAAAGYALLAGAIGIAGYGVYATWGMKGLFWMAVAVATPITVGLVLRLLGFFFTETRLGKVIVKVAIWSFVVTSVCGIGWALLQAT